MQVPTTFILIDDDGHPRTINKRVKVHMIAKKHRYGVTPVDIAQHYQITLADVYGALAYYHANRADFDALEDSVQPLIRAGKQQSDLRRQQIEQRLQDKQRNSE